MRVLISTDTSCLLNYEMLQKYNISIFPLNVIVDGNEFLDSVTINQETLCNDMKSNKIIKTSTPPMGVVVEYFEGLFKKGYDKIIHFTISSKLSSMHSLFSTVSSNYFDNNIIVVDSMAFSTVMLEQVLYTYETIKKGIDIDTIIKQLIERRKDEKLYFIPENLNALKNGGRISPTAAVIANTIGIKPVLSLTDGELVKEGITKNVKSAFVKRIDELLKVCPVEHYDYTIVNFYAKESVLNSIKEYFNCVVGESRVIMGIVPINLCAHCGPGTIGVSVTKKIEGKSLKEFN